ncbi:MAG: diacylglycerol kinase family lipid kinase [Oscillospiraceae bacterium]|jgi:YegS/Rv2252/BmrU family lipid kinase|nr:diacylglycerol kinase family lipid kinase [Oscillospiraceae bacterium]
MKHLFIINPIAGGMKGNTEKIENEIKEFVDTIDDSYEIYITTGRMDACRKIIEDAEVEEKLYVYACGGDGTLNECANGAAGRDNVAITHHPCGTGNDFLKTFGKENIDHFRNFKALSEGSVQKIDLIDCDGRYGINICSVGIDARIGTDVHKYSGIPIIGGSTGYVVALVVNVIKGVARRFKIKMDETEIDDEITLACACNGRYYGGGFNPVPDAVPDDGLLDCLIAKGVSRFEVAKLVGIYSKGRYHEHPHYFTYSRCHGMDIEGDRDFVVNIDGEAVYTNKISFKIVPNHLNFIFPSDFAPYK